MDRGRVNQNNAKVPILEKAVHTKHKGTIQQYEDALKKASLLFDNVEKYSGYQCALLSNGKGDKKTEFTTLYTSSVDYKIHTVKLDYYNVEFLRTEIKYSYKPIHLSVEGFNGYGVVNHAGAVVVPPDYDGYYEGESNVIDICRAFLLAQKDWANRKMTDIFDYLGNRHIRLWGHMHLLYGKLNFNGIDFQLIANHKDDNIIYKDGGKGWDLYAVYDGKLYKVFSTKKESVYFDISCNTLIMYERNELGEPLRRWGGGEILTDAIEVVPVSKIR